MSNTSTLPPGWTIALASEVCEKIQDGTHFSPKIQLDSGDYPYVTAKNVRPTGLDLANLTYLRAEDHKDIYRRCNPKKGDVLLVKDGVNAGDAAINTIDGEISLLSSVCFFRPRPEVLHAGFIRYYLLAPETFRHLAGKLTGTAIKRIVLERVRALPVLLAPLKEQRRIVEVVESYLTRLGDAIATLERVGRNLKRYRASVLKSAVEGRLVASEAVLAKQEGRDYESASALLERILTERRRRWSESGKKGKYHEPTPPDTTNLPNLPEGWCWASIDSLIWDADYGTSQKCTYEAAGPAVLRIPNVQEQALRLDDLKFATDPKQLNADGAVKAGDLIFIRTNGSRNLIGRGAVILDELPTIHHFASYLIRLRVLPVGGLPRWTGFAWHTPMLREQILYEAASSAGQYNVSMKAATRFAMPLAPAAEQERILEEVDRIDSLAEATMAAATAAADRTARLRQSILKWAFEGKLADQDPSDEPASVLLERIKAERDTVNPAHTTRPKRVAGKKVRA